MLDMFSKEKAHCQINHSWTVILDVSMVRHVAYPTYFEIGNYPNSISRFFSSEPSIGAFSLLLTVDGLLHLKSICCQLLVESSVNHMLICINH